MEQAVNEAWAQAQPDAALAEAMTAPNAPWARNTAWAAIETLADGDPRRQLEALGHLPASRLRAELCESAVTALARFAALAPELTLRVADTMLVSKVLSAAAKRDGAAALAAADALPEELHGQARGAALVGWAYEHPVAALEWAVAHGVDVSEAKTVEYVGDDGTRYYSLLRAAFQSDREKTLAWVRAQPKSSERDTMLDGGIWSGTTERKIELFNEFTPVGKAAAAWRMVQSSFQNGTGRIAVGQSAACGRGAAGSDSGAHRPSGQQRSREHRHARRCLARRRGSRCGAEGHGVVLYAQRPASRARFCPSRGRLRRPRILARISSGIVAAQGRSRCPRVGRQRAGAFRGAKARAPSPARRSVSRARTARRCD